ncbi:MAG: alpha-xylosidase, partial [Clostridia bacterium]|nr:alpha-xylosidase [Clostridia bacterium]
FCLGHIRKGIFGENGVSEYDDGKSFLLEENGGVSPRAGKCVDKYIFAFGQDYLGGLKEFYALTGATPILPKYALSNWWSRYHAYSDKEYLALMDKFESKDVPLTVATIDMDWHIVKNVPKGTEYHSMQGAGWTGYTFEKSLFPDYKAFLKNLKNRGLAITMNLHPRDGVRSFEVQYRDMAKACGINPDSGKTVEFDLTDERFLNAYFDILHHPYEEDGVDFWWIDWQQGTKSKMKGLDPLWLLNHYHFIDNCRGGKKGMILSRYAGLGSHRYPLGFSGDTVVCWKSLKFQPYFTALASNAGYTWWSHDIGGHLFGKGNEELYLRWLQYGVFSPINRLHSNNKAWSKEPWLYP